MAIKVLMTLIATVCVSVTSAQVTASFIVGPTAGCSPLYVALTNTSIGSGTLTYQWNFGFNKGINSTIPEPSTTYPTCGHYTITLIASNGTSTDTARKVVTVYCNPIIGFTLSNYAGCPGTCITFTDTSKAVSGTITTKLWDFGDGTTSTAFNPPTHCYTATSLYTLSLQETNSFGCTTTATFPNIFKIYPKPIGNFSAPVTSSCSAPFPVHFNNTFINGAGNTNGLQYDWTFGDPASGVNNFSTITNPTHTYNAPGSYTVSLIVTDINGCKDTLTKANYIVIGNTTLSITPSVATGCCPLPVTIKVNSNLVPITYSWNYGGAATNDSVPAPAFTIPCPAAQQTYTITLTAGYAGGCMATASTTVTVKPTPTASFTLSGNTVTCAPPTTITIKNTTTPTTGITYNWTFGNGNTSTSASPSNQTYSACGGYNIMLVAKNASNCADTFKQSNAVSINCIHANFTVQPKKLCAGGLVKFTADSIVGFSGTYNWTFGDGSTSSSTSPVTYHSYSTINCFNVKLVVKVGTMCADSITINNAVCTYSPPNIDTFYATPVFSCPSKIVAFKDSISNLVAAPNDSIHWSFGDGGTSKVQNPAYQYGDTGFFSVKLTACNYGCCDTMVRPKYIYIYPPISIPQVTLNCDSPYVRYFIGTQSIGANHYYWNFGDTASHAKDSSHLTDPRHVYTARGDYNATLNVTNDSSGCYNKSGLTIHIRVIKALFTFNKVQGCAPQPIICTNTSQDAVSQTWQVILRETGAVVYIATGTNLNTTVSTPGHYAVRLIAVDINNCKDTILHDSVAIVYGFNMAFIGTPVSGCNPLAVTFTDQATSPNSTAIRYSWTFGDTSLIDTSNLANPKHTYYQTKCYAVTLKIIDNHGCTSTLTKNNYICVNTPYPDFTANRHSCPYSPVVFTPNIVSPGTISKYTWNFGDPTSGTSNTSALSNPSHTYKIPGRYTVSLTVVNSFSCSGSIIKTQYITVTKPTAVFSTPDSTHAICPPLTVNFVDSSYTKVIAWNWAFGDGSGSVVKNPTHIYNAAGSFNVSLIVSDSFGCLDTLTKPKFINIGGPIATVTYTPKTGCAPLKVHFNANASFAKTYVWDYGNTTSGLLLNADTITFTYLTPGIYHPKVIIDNGAGCVLTFVSKDSVVVTGSQLASSFAPPLNCQGATVVFKDTLLAGTAIAHQLWNFGDPTSGKADTSTKLKKASHIYSKAGTFIEMLRVFSGTCIDTLRDTVLIHANPTAAIGVLNNFCAGDTARFIDSTQADTTIIFSQWHIYDNGSVSTISFTPEPIHIYTKPGTYPVTLTETDAYGCTDSVKRNVTVYSLPTVTTVHDTTVCAKDSVRLSASGGVRYLWTPANYLNNDTIANPITQPAAAITYTVRVTDKHTCTNTATVTIKVHALPVVIGYPDTAVCIGNWIHLKATGAITYNWSPSTYLDSTLIASPISHPLKSINYILKGRDSIGCSNIDTVHITVNSLPVLSITPDTIICAGRSIQLSASGAAIYIWTPVSYLSDPGIPNPIATPPDTMKYYVNATDVNGCKNIDSVKIYTIQRFKLIVSANDTVCYENTVQLSAAGGKTYTWYPASELSDAYISDPTAKVYSTFTYTVIAYDGRCFYDTGYAYVVVLPLPVLTGGTSAYTISAGDSVRIGFPDTMKGKYVWSPANYLSCNTCSNPTAFPPTTQKYILTYTDLSGCSTHDSVTIDVTCAGGKIYIPNAFTPTDRINNIFRVRSNAIKQLDYLRVFDRWGKLLFESDDIDLGWDGRINGKLAEPGVYVYYMQAVCLTGDILVRKGNITLIR